MKKNNFYYFKKALLLIVPIAIFVIVRDLFDIPFNDGSAFLKTIVKGLSVGVITGIILGVINIFAKVETFKKDKN